MSREQKLEELLKRVLEEVLSANEELGGYFNHLAEEENQNLQDLGLNPLEIVQGH